MNITPSDAHILRVTEELKSVGVTRHGLAKTVSRKLPSILHEDEHIGGVIYGRINNNKFAMLVATDRRVIYLNHQLFFMTTDELTYDVVSGVRSSTVGPFTSVVLHTRVADYSFRYVNAKCAEIFIKFIETKRLEKGTYDQTSGRYQEETSTLPTFQNITDKKAGLFLKKHDLAVFSTVDRTGNVHGAVVHYLVDQNNFIYILTKSDTGKARNVYAHSQVALTIHEPGTLQTLQIQGIAEIETNQKMKDSIFEQMVQSRIYKDKTYMPPVTKLQEGSFIIIRISASHMSYHDYAKG